MKTATRKGVDEAGDVPPIVRAAAAMEGLNESAKRIEKYRKFAENKRDTGAESGVIVDGCKLPQDMFDKAVKLLRDHGGAGPDVVDPDDQMAPPRSAFVDPDTEMKGYVLSTSTTTPYPTAASMTRIEYVPYVPYRKTTAVLKAVSIIVIVAVVLVLAAQIAFWGWL